MTLIPSARRVPRARLLLPIVTLLAAMFLPVPVPGAPTQGTKVPRVVIGNDPGGMLRPRIAKIAHYRRTGTRVEIRGRVCYSACTIYLGAGNVCVSPGTKFGFHAPLYRNDPIAFDRFDHWSRVMAEYYPPEVANWYIKTARYVFKGVLTITGAELIRLGIPKC